MKMVFKDFDLDDFWEDYDYAIKEYLSAPVTQEMIEEIEEKLGYKLPNSYVELMKIRNGGMPKKTSFRMNQSTSWADDHVAITGIYGIGSIKRSSLDGGFGSRFWIEEWGYPDIGVYFADCPSAGHDMICLDYRQCEGNDEPQVVHVDQEYDYKITFVAKDFETFIKGLVSEEVFN